MRASYFPSEHYPDRFEITLPTRWSNDSDDGLITVAICVRSKFIKLIYQNLFPDSFTNRLRTFEP